MTSQQQPFVDPEADTGPVPSAPPRAPEPAPEPDPALQPLPDRKVPPDASALVISEAGDTINLKLVLPEGVNPDDDNAPLSATVAMEAMQHIASMGKE